MVVSLDNGATDLGVVLLLIPGSSLGDQGISGLALSGTVHPVRILLSYNHL